MNSEFIDGRVRDERRDGPGSRDGVVLGAGVVQQAAAGCSHKIDKIDKSDCSLAPPGQTFTFHVTNTGTAYRRLTYGCGATRPITLPTPQGELSIGPGEVNGCEFSLSSITWPR